MRSRQSSLQSLLTAVNQSINQSEITQCLVRLIVPAVYSNGKPILLVSFKDKGLQTAFSPEPCIKQNYNAEMTYFLAKQRKISSHGSAEKHFGQRLASLITCSS